jgi:hypothetical protein
LKITSKEMMITFGVIDVINKQKKSEPLQKAARLNEYRKLIISL